MSLIITHVVIRENNAGFLSCKQSDLRGEITFNDIIPKSLKQNSALYWRGCTVKRGCLVTRAMNLYRGFQKQHTGVGGN